MTYGYNLLDQVTSKTYSDSTPGATYTYDHGRRVSAVSAGVTQQSTAFDGFSRITASTQSMEGVTYTFGYGYNLADGLKTLTLPSGRVISTAFDSSSGRPLSVSGSYNGQNTSYASNVTYAPHGAVSSLGMGNGLAEITSYNSRLRPSQITAGSLLTLGYGYSSNHDNGSVRSQTITVSGGGAYTQSYTYDLVDRLATASETKDGSTTWSETFGYDNVGNRWVSAMSPSGIETGLAPTASTAFNSSNQITSSGGTYSGGNQTAFGGFQFDYDAENRQTESRMMNGAIVLNTTDYAYDADGRRVKKSVVGGAATAYVYDAFGNLAAEYGTVVNGDAGVRYLTIDALGSTRMVTDGTGARVECHDYLPFGVELQQSIGSRPSCYAADNIKLKFTGKERDGQGENNGLDYFGARYYGAAQGRFTTPDEFVGGPYEVGGAPSSKPGPLPYADITNPQSLNKYAYAFNNPLRYVDPDGHEPLDGQEVLEALRDSFVGYGKEAANTVIGLANTVNRPIDATLSTFTDFRFGQIKEFEATNKVQGNAMLGMAIIGMVGTGGESGGVKLVSAIGKDKGLARLAQEAGSSVQKGIDTLTSQLAKGNLNPGIGTKNLFGNISYARARDGARVFFRQAGNQIEILAKASKKNEAQVIKKLEELYK